MSRTNKIHEKPGQCQVFSIYLCMCSECSCCLLCTDLVLFDKFKKCVFFEQVKLKVQFIYLAACIY